MRTAGHGGPIQKRGLAKGAALKLDAFTQLTVGKRDRRFRTQFTSRSHGGCTPREAAPRMDRNARGNPFRNNIPTDKHRFRLGQVNAACYQPARYATSVS